MKWKKDGKKEKVKKKEPGQFVAWCLEQKKRISNSAEMKIYYIWDLGETAKHEQGKGEGRLLTLRTQSSSSWIYII